MRATASFATLILVLLPVAMVGCLRKDVRPISERLLLEEEGKTSTIVDTKIRQYEELADEYPEEPKYFERLSELYEAKDDYQSALYYIGKAQDLEPQNPKYHFREGRIYYGIGNYTRAEKAFQEMLERTPEGQYTGPHMELAMLYIAMERPSQAATQFERCIEIDPGFPLPHYYLGELALVRRDSPAAIEHFEEYLRKGGQRFHEEALQKLYRLQPNVARDGIDGAAPARGVYRPDQERR